MMSEDDNIDAFVTWYFDLQKTAVKGHIVSGLQSLVGYFQLQNLTDITPNAGWKMLISPENDFFDKDNAVLFHYMIVNRLQDTHYKTPTTHPRVLRCRMLMCRVSSNSPKQCIITIPRANIVWYLMIDYYNKTGM